MYRRFKTTEEVQLTQRPWHPSRFKLGVVQHRPSPLNFDENKNTQSSRHVEQTAKKSLGRWKTHGLNMNSIYGNWSPGCMVSVTAVLLRAFSVYAQSLPISLSGGVVWVHSHQHSSHRVPPALRSSEMCERVSKWCLISIHAPCCHLYPVTTVTPFMKLMKQGETVAWTGTERDTISQSPRSL